MNNTEPRWSCSALTIIDMQNDFALPGAPAEIPGTSEVIPNVKKLAAAYREARLPIIHVIRLYKADGSNADLCRKEGIEQGRRIVTPETEGAQIVADLLPFGGISLDSDALLAGGVQPIGDAEWILYKPRWGAFYQTPLEVFLKERAVDTLLFCGCNFPNCPRTSIYEASERDFRIALAHDAVSGIYDRGMAELKNIHVRMKGTDAILRELNA